MINFWQLPDGPTKPCALQIQQALTAKAEVRNRVSTDISVATKALSHDQEVAHWFAIDGDKTLRLDYDLDENSVVFDLGGYEGRWTADIHCMYGCRVFIFEPVVEFAANISRRFKKNSRVQVFAFGLSDQTKTVRIAMDADGSSQYKSSEVAVDVQLVRAADFLEQSGVEFIDLMKINIEGGEYDLLEHLIEIGFLTKVKNFQVQFHDWSPNAAQRLAKIQATLKKTHRLTYHYRTVWENWELLEEQAIEPIFPDSIAGLQSLIDSNTGDQQAYIQICRLLLAENRVEEAEKYFEDACELDISNPELDEIGRIIEAAA